MPTLIISKVVPLHSFTNKRQGGEWCHLSILLYCGGRDTAAQNLMCLFCVWCGGGTTSKARGYPMIAMLRSLEAWRGLRQREGHVQAGEWQSHFVFLVWSPGNSGSILCTAANPVQSFDKCWSRTLQHVCSPQFQHQTPWLFTEASSLFAH